jgi:hypothetical protein
MANIRLSKTVYKKDEIDKAIDNRFTSFVEKVEEDNDTVAEFFRLYEKLFLEIPPTGQTQSHEYLIRESSKLVRLDGEDEEIQPLLDEISDLRQRLLEANIESLDTQNELINSFVQDQQYDFSKDLDKIREGVESSGQDARIARQPKPAAPTRPEPAPAPAPAVTKKKRRIMEVMAEALRLKRKGLTKQEIRTKLEEFGANKYQIRRVT